MGSSPFEAASFDVSLDAGCGMGFSAAQQGARRPDKAFGEAILAPYERAKTLEIPVLDKCTHPMPRALPRRAADRATVTSLGAAGGPRAEGANAHLHDHRRARCG